MNSGTGSFSAVAVCRPMVAISTQITVSPTLTTTTWGRKRAAVMAAGRIVQGSAGLALPR